MGAAGSVGLICSDEHVHPGKASDIKKKMDELMLDKELTNEKFHDEMKQYFASLHPPEWQWHEKNANISSNPSNVHVHHHAQVHHGHMTKANEASSELSKDSVQLLEAKLAEANKKRHEEIEHHDHVLEEEHHHHHHHHHHESNAPADNSNQHYQNHTHHHPVVTKFDQETDATPTDVASPVDQNGASSHVEEDKELEEPIGNEEA